MGMEMGMGIADEDGDTRWCKGSIALTDLLKRIRLSLRQRNGYAHEMIIPVDEVAYAA